MKPYWYIITFTYRNNSSSFERFHLAISREEMYGGTDPTIPELLVDMATEPIVHLGQFSSSLHKLIFLKNALIMTHMNLPASKSCNNVNVIHIQRQITHTWLVHKFLRSVSIHERMNILWIRYFALVKIDNIVIKTDCTYVVYNLLWSVCRTTRRRNSAEADHRFCQRWSGALQAHEVSQMYSVVTV